MKSRVQIIFCLLAWVTLMPCGEAKSLTPKPQNGSPDSSVQTFMGSHHELSMQRKISSVLVDRPERLERRTRDYAKQYGVTVQVFEFLPFKAVKKSEFLQPIPVRTVIRGDLDGVIAHLKRMSLFATAQTPLHMEMSSIQGSSDPYELTTVIDYYRIARPQEYYRYGDPKMSHTAYYAVEVERSEDRKIEQMRKATAVLVKRQENALLPELLDPLHASCHKADLHPCFNKLHWSKEKGLEIISRKENLAHGS